MKLDEASTRLMVNHFLSDVLGYKELDEIKAEYRIADKYADYVIQLKRKKHFIVEVKAAALDINEKHFRQALEYASNEGIDWVFLTNGRSFSLYRVIFKRPISFKKIFEHSLLRKRQLDGITKDLMLITRDSVENGLLEAYWKRFQAASPENIAPLLYNKRVVNFVKNHLLRETGIKFTDQDVIASLCAVIKDEIETSPPKKPIQ